MMIKGFWHIAQLNNWQQVVKEQWDRLKKSGLYDATYKLHVNIASDSDGDVDGDFFNTILYDDKVIVSNSSLKLFEHKVLHDIWTQSQESDFNAYYIHTKGVSTPSIYQTSWRRYMESFIIDHWRQCCDTLNLYDSVGVEFRSKPLWHWAGNFWWAKSQHIKNLSPLFDSDGELKGNRYSAEMWVLENHPKIYCLSNKCLSLHVNKVSDYSEWNDGYAELLNMVLDVGSDNLALFGGRYEGGIHLQQRPEELATALYLLKDKKFNTILEIGAAAGGLSNILQNFYNVNVNEMLIIDNNMHPKYALRNDILPNCVEFIGDSHSVEAKKWLQNQKSPDLIVIDGDHLVEGVYLDTELALSVAHYHTIIFFHDCLACHGVIEVFKKCKEDSRLNLLYTIGDAGGMSAGLGIALFEVLCNPLGEYFSQ